MSFTNVYFIFIFLLTVSANTAIAQLWLFVAFMFVIYIFTNLHMRATPAYSGIVFRKTVKQDGAVSALVMYNPFLFKTLQLSKESRIAANRFGVYTFVPNPQHLYVPQPFIQSFRFCYEIVVYCILPTVNFVLVKYSSGWYADHAHQILFFIVLFVIGGSIMSAHDSVYCRHKE